MSNIVTIVKYKREDGTEETLEQEMIRRGCLPPIAYGFKSCSEKYKIRPLNRFLKDNHKYIFEGERMQFADTKNLRKKLLHEKF